MRLLSMLARGAEIPVFAAIGAQGLTLVETMRPMHGVRLVETPRHARILLVAGAVDASHLRNLERLHAQLPPPRGTVWWQAPRLFSRGEMICGDDPLSAILRAAKTDNPDQRPDVSPHPWHGMGPHGELVQLYCRAQEAGLSADMALHGENLDCAG